MTRPTRVSRWAIWARAFLVLGMAGCGGEQGSESRPLVMVSVLPQKYVVDRVAGALVRVEVMIPPGANPSTYEPSLTSMSLLGDAALYVKVGHPHFPFEEAWLDRILAEAPGLPVVDGSAGVQTREGDPHVWVAPRHVEQMAVRLELALGKILPEHRETLQANLASFRSEITALDGEIRELLADKEGSRFLVFHPSWGHFADAYGLVQVAIEHEHKEPGAHELGELIEHARQQSVQVVFIQPQFDRSAADTLAREIDARVEPLDPLAYDWPANLRRAARSLAEGMVD